MGPIGETDEFGAANYVTGHTVVRGAECVRRGSVFSLALAFDSLGPQKGLGPRINSPHLMLRLPTDPYLEGRTERFTDDAVYLPLQGCNTVGCTLPHVLRRTDVQRTRVRQRRRQRRRV